MNAIEQISQLRERVTRMLGGEEKRLAYVTIFQMVRDYGYFAQMMEAAPFAGIVVSEDDLEECAHVARINEDLRNFMMALRALKRSLRPSEFVAFISESDGDGSALLEIIDRHVPPTALTPAQWFAVESLRAIVS